MNPEIIEAALRAATFALALAAAVALLLRHPRTQATGAAAFVIADPGAAFREEGGAYDDGAAKAMVAWLRARG